MHLSCQGKPPGCKLLRLDAEMDFSILKSPVVRKIMIHGDFFAIPEETFDILESSLKDIPLEDFAQVFDSRAKEAKLQLAGITGEGIAAVLRSSIDAP
jgi:hypothetical protein